MTPDAQEWVNDPQEACKKAYTLAIGSRSESASKELIGSLKKTKRILEEAGVDTTHIQTAINDNWLHIQTMNG